MFLVINLVQVAQAQSSQEAEENLITPDDTIDRSYDDKQAYSGQSLKDAAHDADFRQYRAPEIVPAGWLSDYDYQVKLDDYLSEQHQSALATNKQTYVYLYSDWYEACRDFRKMVAKKDMDALFSANNIVMLDYNFFKKKFNTRAHHLPMILKVNEDGVLGPELIYPLSKPNAHPRKVYHELRKFFKQG